MSVNMKIVEVGTRVRCALYFAGEGVVYEIHGAQVPESISTMLGGAGVSGGVAKFDVVFANGHVAKCVPEAIVRGIQWTIHDETATANEIAELLEHADLVRMAKEAAAREAAEAFAAEVERLRTAQEFAHLIQGDDQYSGLLAAKNMRVELRKAFPAVKFSIRKRHFGSVSINWTDGPTEKEVEDVVSQHKGGYFDGMDDSYKHVRTPFVVVFGGVEYVSAYREHSPALVERAIDKVFAEYAGNLTGISKPAAAEFSSGELFRVAVPYLNDSLQQLVRQQVYAMPG